MERARPVIFHRKGCVKSEKALEYLENRKIGYEPVEVKENEGAIQQLERTTGQTRTPALVFNREHIHDFGLPELAGFLQKYQLDKRTPR